MSCILKVNQHGFLALRIFWRGLRAWEGTGLKDTPENRRLVEAKALLLNAEMDAGSFDYLRHFPKGNKAPVVEAAQQKTAPLTIGEYYRTWIERKKPPMVRPGLARDYREHFRLYILPKFETVAWSDLTAATLEAYRAYLAGDRGLSIKTCKNVINGSFRACYRDARKIDRLPELQGAHPFADLSWPRTAPRDRDPFTEDERDKILSYFKQKIPHYYPFVLTQFFTGMRPSEALGLRWSDVDFQQHAIFISKSRYIGDDATKTAASLRTIKLPEIVADELEALFSRTARRLDDDGQDYVFLNEDGNPLDFHTWRGKVSGRKTIEGGKTPHGVWYRALRGAQVRPRGPYHTRHTFISVALSYGANIKWLASYCGTSIEMIEKHYGKYIRNDVDEQLERALGRQSATFAAQSATSGDEREKVAEKLRKGGGPTWIRTQPQLKTRKKPSS